jgi:hypothetical protein
MDWLEQELKRALARKEPPAGFADEVTEAVEEATPRRSRHRVIAWPRRTVAPWLAAAAAVVLMVGGGMGYRWHQGMVAKRQVMQAFAIAGGQLNHLRTHLKEARQ